ncbi:DUF499 domain-containing protein [Natronorubrum thiooxidans]|uniref:DUF499 domain-containing protein n=1 Tax=Natronorubrum thiooxidans TaxID=308853 RepID=A0A1N7H2D1_9EURY|nr:DUF499 domain-containing protein [Natronorubrum thiooxidans]SIS19002.1 Protein of unknown function [Natronorubrum thiooxidans]
MKVSDFLTPRDEVVEGRFQGVLQAHKVGSSDDRLENDSSRLLSMTYPSNALQTAFDHVDNKLRGRDAQGGITLSGPYGAGKSHGLLTLYHLFDSPELAQDWLDEWDIPLNLPTTAHASILSTSKTDADRIWEPIFEDLGREDILDDINRYPTTDHIEELAADETVAIFFDEIETWWESFSDTADEELVERNEFFLQNLFEVANDPDYNLFTFVTLLDKSEDLKRILNRTSPYAVDLNSTGDRERIILHRLFETRREDIDESAVRDVVREYVDNYSYPIEIEEEKRYENRMVETYPFHPELLDLLDSLYEGGRERQNVRGAMNVLADTVRRLYDETDLIITSDINAAAFRGINQTLFNRYRSDLDAIAEIDYGDDLLKTIHLYTLDERRQEASITECLIGTYKPEKTSVSKLDMSLGNLYGTAHYLDRDSSKENYFITEDPKLTALVTREQERVLDGDHSDIEAKLMEVVRDDVWDGDVHVYPDEDIPESKEIQVVVMLDYLSNGALRSELDSFFEGRTYQNTVLFVAPKQEIRDDDDIISKAARVLGAENLQGKVEDEQGELGKIIRDERRELRNELEDRYGNWIKWSEDPRGGVRLRKKSVIADVDDVKDKVGRDKTYVGEKILDEVEDAENGISLDSMLNDFRQFRRMPVILDKGVFTSALSKLYRDEKVVLEGDRGKFYAAHKNDPLPDLGDGLTIHSPKNLDEAVYTKTDTGSSGGSTGDDGGTSSTGGATGGGGSTVGGTSGGSSGGSSGGTAGGTSGGGTVASQTEETRVTLEGPSARVLRSHAESRVNGDTDTVTHVDLSYDVDDLSKEELIELIEALPSAKHIEATVVIEREVQD